MLARGDSHPMMSTRPTDGNGEGFGEAGVHERETDDHGAVK